MAIDVYLQIDGIKGEFADSEHQGWIECTSVHWKLHQPRSARKMASNSPAGIGRTWLRTESTARPLFTALHPTQTTHAGPHAGTQRVEGMP